ncbi:MAG: phosphoribosylglycinamide formyltransferase [Chthoniobacterales bacterium]
MNFTHSSYSESGPDHKKRLPLPRLGVLGSGKGSNFSAILEAVSEKKLAAEIVFVASDHANAGILKKASAAGLPTYVIEETKFKTRLSENVERKLVEQMQNAGVEVLVLAGYMRVIKAPTLEAFAGKIINIHPSLLPKFRGLEAWRQALEAGENEAGCTVHLVDEGIDTGRILAQARVPVLPDDTAESLHARIQVQEHRLYPETLRQFLQNLS